MQASISVSKDPTVQYLLRLGDSALVLGQRLGEWCGHGPVLEEDIALSNMALDLIGQARALLTLAGQHDGQGHDEDRLAFLRDERDFLNVTMAELPNGLHADAVPGDFALTVLRNFLLASWFKQLWLRLQASRDAELAAIAAKALKEARYHQQHAADWVVRLGDGTLESAARMAHALERLWPYTAELFDDDAIDEAAAAAGLGPRASDLRPDWLADVREVFQEAQLPVPADPVFRSDGKRGRHSEHMGHMLAQMQYLQRAYPGGAW